jgi:hypothetical protein
MSPVIKDRGTNAAQLLGGTGAERHLWLRLSSFGVVGSGGAFAESRAGLPVLFENNVRTTPSNEGGMVSCVKTKGTGPEGVLLFHP